MAEVVKENASEILSSLIKEKGLMKSFIARKLGMKPSDISNRLSGRVKIDADFALKVSKVLEVDPDIFLNSFYSKRIK